MARKYSSRATEQALTSSVNSTVTLIQVSGTTGFPLQTPYTLRLDPDLPGEEVVTVTAQAGTDLTVVRGEDGTSAQSHSVGAKVRHGYSARDFSEPQEHIDAAEAVHGVGVGSAVVGTDTTQVLRNKTLDGDDNTFRDIPQSSVTGLTTALATNASAISAEVTARSNAVSAEAAARATGDANTLLAAAPPGSIHAYAGASAPSGWLLCDGSAVSRTTYAALFAVVGTAFNTGGEAGTDFRLPNLKGRVPVGIDSAQTEFDTRGETGGEKTHTLTEAEIPAHDHDVTVSGSPAVGGQTSVAFAGGGTGFAASGSVAAIDVADTGGGGAHNNLQPYIALHFIIRT